MKNIFKDGAQHKVNIEPVKRAIYPNNKSIEQNSILHSTTVLDDIAIT